MASDNYYVKPDGDDTAIGTSWDTAWATIAQCYTSVTPDVASANEYRIAPGVYRETLAVDFSGTPSAEQKFIAWYGEDDEGTDSYSGHGKGIVRITTLTSGDKATSADDDTIDLIDPYTTWEGLWIENYGTGERCIVFSAGVTNTTIRRCFLHGSNDGVTTDTTPIYINTTEGVASDNTVEDCILIGDAGIAIVPRGHASLDIDLNITIRNNVIIAFDTGIDINGAPGTVDPTGIDIYGNTILAPIGIKVADALKAGGCQVHNNIIFGVGFRCLEAPASPAGQLVSDFNILHGATIYTNVLAGDDDKSGLADGADGHPPLLEFGQSQLFGLLPKMPFSPHRGSPALGFGNDVTYNTTDDMLGVPRTSGAGFWGSILPAVGALAYHECAEQESTTKDDGNFSAKIVGPGVQRIMIPVNAESTTISIKAQYDTAHGTGSPPQVTLLAAPEMDAPVETEVAGGTADQWDILTFDAFTPPSAGWVILQLESRAAAANGIAYFDTVAVS